MSQRISALEGVRGWASLLIVIYHLPKWNAVLDIALINNGHFMVELFFVLSGFVIYSAYGTRINSAQALMRFQFLRFWRLYPVHLLFLAAFFAFECVRWVSVTYLHVQDIRVAPFSQNSLTALVQQLFLVQAIGPTGNAQTFNGPAWSISVEFYAYVVFGLLSLASRRYLPFAMLAVLCLGSGLLFVDTGFETFLICLVGFSIGCLTAELSRRHGGTLPGWTGSIALLVFFGYLQFAAAPTLGVVFALAALLVFSVSRVQGGLALTLLGSRWSLWLGAVSYSLYMCHTLVLWFTAIGFKRGLGFTESARPDGKWVLDLNVWQTLLAAGIAVAACLVVAHLVLKFVEAPLRDWSRRKTGARPLSAPVGAPGADA